MKYLGYKITLYKVIVTSFSSLKEPHLEKYSKLFILGKKANKLKIIFMKIHILNSRRIKLQF